MQGTSLILIDPGLQRDQDQLLAWAYALESGAVLHIENAYALFSEERAIAQPQLLAPKSRNISYGIHGALKGAAGSQHDIAIATQMLARFSSYAQGLLNQLFPHYTPHLRLAPASYRPLQVEQRIQSWRADDRRLHIDAFPSRPNQGERILRVFANVNGQGEPRVWRIGESFEAAAQRMLPRFKAYSRWQAHALHTIGITKSLRSEYDHLMLQLHDAMKADLCYQRDCPQITQAFPPGSVWICYSDQTSHAVMSGQHMMELTAHLAVEHQYFPERSPLAVLQRLTGRNLLS